jgi:hypothetical protein
MSVYRAALVAVTALFVAATTSAASAGCYGHFRSFGYVAAGCGVCGGCGGRAAFVYAPPRPRNCGCRPPVIYTPAEVVPTPIAPAPIYVVNQGPDYTGPGIMVPYRTWSPPGSYVVVRPHPLIRHYGYGHAYYHHWYAHRSAYRAHFYAHPHHHPMPMWQGHPHYYQP